MRFPFRLLLGLLGALLLVGCGAHVLPEEALRQVDPSVTFELVRENPERFQGSTLVLGGRILENRADESGSTLEILRYRLDRFGRPVEIEEAGERFLARSGQFLDPEIYEKGRLVTLTGTVLGSEVRQLNEVDYLYPVFGIGAIHDWSAQPSGYYQPYYPYAYPPYYRPYWHDPYWYDPFWSRHPYRYYPYGW